MNHSSSEHQATHRYQLWQRALALAVLLAAAWLLSLAWPRLQASMHYLPVDTAIKRYYASGVLPVQQLPALAARAAEATVLQPHYRYYEGLSFIAYLQALDSSASRAERLAAMQQSLAAAEQAVQRAPAKPATWLRVAMLRSALGQGTAAVAPPLTMSILTGRVEPTLLLPRLELGLRYLAALDEDTVSLLRDQAVLTWRVNPRQVVQAVKKQQLELEQVKSLLGAGNADLIAELEAKL
jgi:hypothetical protein